MGVLGRSVFLLTVCWFSFTIDADAKPLFLCDDGKTVLLTDRAELGCPVYKPKAELTTVPDGATWADVEWAAALKLAENEQQRSAPSARLRAQPCDEAEWGDLTLPRDGELGMEMDEPTRQLLELSRIVTPTNLCEESLAKQVYPRF